MATDKLTAKQRMFVTEYLVSLNATDAARKAGYSEKTADRIGPELLGKTCVQEAIREAINARAERTKVNADRVDEELWDVVTADTNDLMELRRGCCRYCWGIEHKYQLTLNEMRERKNSFKEQEQKAIEEGKEPPIFNPLGGDGYNKNREPNPNCPECFGDGIYQPYFKDTRKLPKGVRALYAGVKITKDGIEVKTHSKEKYIEMLGKHLGMFVDKKEISGPNGGPIETIDKTDPAAVEARINELIRKRESGT